MQTKDFILASGSPQRRALLESIGMFPKDIRPAGIDETPFSGEEPLPYIRRMALSKAQAAAAANPGENVLSADMRLLSGRTHRVITSVCLIDRSGHISQKTVTTKIVMKHLTDAEIAEYVASGEWHDVAGYKIEGLLAGFVKKIIGSHSGVIGLPLYETRNLLNGAGIR